MSKRLRNYYTIFPEQVQQIYGYLDIWENITFDDKRLMMDLLVTTMEATSEKMNITWNPIGISLSVVGFIFFLFCGYQMWGLVCGIILLDIGVQTAQISNQAKINSLMPLHVVEIMLFT